MRCPIKVLFNLFEESEEPFYCPHCRLVSQDKQLQQLKSIVEKLSKEVVLLKTTIVPDCMESSSPPPQQKLSLEVQSTSTATSKETQPAIYAKTATTARKSNNREARVQEDCKYNVVVYGIKECGKGTPRQERLNHDLEKVTSIVTEGENSINPLSICDLLRPGKYHEKSKQPRPILVKLNQTINVSQVQSKARFLSKEIRIKPDMSQEERQIESLLLKERWVLIQAGTECKVIKIRGTKIFFSNKLHGQIINSSFVPFEAEQIETEMDSSST